jgi:DNA-binding Lrp family transcriptional regulator
MGESLVDIRGIVYSCEYHSVYCRFIGKTFSDRLRALRERGVIQGFHAEVDLAALGRPLQALIAVRLAVHAREQIDAFTEAVRSVPGVLMVFHLTGVTDYLVWVAAADAQDLREFVVDHLATHPSVAHAETSLIYEHRRGPGIWGAADPA